MPGGPGNMRGGELIWARGNLRVEGNSRAGRDLPVRAGGFPGGSGKCGGEELIWARGSLRVEGNSRAGRDLPVRAEECPGALAMRGPSARKIPGGMQSVGAGRDLPCNFAVGQIFLDAGLCVLRFTAAFGGRSLRSRI